MGSRFELFTVDIGDSKMVRDSEPGTVQGRLGQIFDDDADLGLEVCVVGYEVCDQWGDVTGYVFVVEGVV